MYTAFLNNINWLAVVVAALAYFALGALWYSKALFAKSWIHHTKIDMTNPDVKKGMTAIMFMSFVFMFITSFGLAVLRSRLELEGWMGGLKLGLIAGLCFGVTAISISYLWEKRSTELHFINGAFTLIGNIIAAMIICCWV